MKKFIKIIVILIFISACNNENQNPQRELTPLSIGKVEFLVETAQTGKELRDGLMFRKSMPKNQGMIFDMKTPRVTSMWMKNTYIPLDIIFVNSQNKVSGFYENAQPFSETLMSSPKETIAVIELNAGMVKKHKIHKGAVVKHDILNKK